MLAINFNLSRGDIWFDERFTRASINQENLDQFKEYYNSLPDAGEHNASNTFEHLLYDVHPFLYYILLKIFTLFFGDSVFVLRFASVIFFIPAIFFSFRILKELKLSQLKILLILLTIVCNPLLVGYGAEARMYTLLASFLAGAVYYFLKSFSVYGPEHKQTIIKFQILLGLSFFVQYIAFFYALILFILFNWLVWLRQPVKSFKEFFLQNWNTFWIAGILAIPNIVLAVFQIMNGVWIGWIEQSSFSLIPRTIYIFLFGADPGTLGGLRQNNFLNLDQRQLDFFQYTIFTLLALIIFMSFLRNRGRDLKDKQIVFLSLTIGPLAITTFVGIVITTIIPTVYDIFGIQKTPGNSSLSFYVERYYLASVVFLLILVPITLHNAFRFQHADSGLLSDKKQAESIKNSSTNLGNMDAIKEAPLFIFSFIYLLIILYINLFFKESGS
jgi:uncharacterized membrane protein